ncbi:translation initiation factor IF-2 [Arenibaculum sp.]|jgi:translation initiation factor IF-2|uniref:translation initiation factor IF-2 n=1 Tax=Arenibaculum sp. TaxID=2865862 RepID=UPI002E0D4B54|nr:translation initiation factor IF-2 [Arenibaculum sp.]
MTDTNDQDRKKVLSLGNRGKLELKKTVDAGSVRQSFSHGRSKTVTVEVKRKRTLEKGAVPGIADGGAAARRAAEGLPAKPGQGGRGQRGAPPVRQLTREERDARLRALQGAIRSEEERRQIEAELAAEQVLIEDEELVEPEPEPILDSESLREREMEELRSIQAAERQAAEEAERRRQEEEAKRREAEAARRKPEDDRKRAAGATTPAAETTAPAAVPGRPRAEEEEDDQPRRKTGAGRPAAAKPSSVAPKAKTNQGRRGGGKLTLTQALNADESERTRSIASLRRARERERQRLASRQETLKVTRDVVIPEAITVQELSNRMAERGADVIKSLMRMGVMATINQSIDADTAELVVAEFGHRSRRVSEADVELGLRSEESNPDLMRSRAPVVTVMGHVDHGKTSLLDALRETDVAAREAGGITQHIGAYQVVLKSGARITFIDTPGHAAFTEMRARGANVTDVVVLVVAADDGIMPQTVEAIHHAKAAKVPIIVAINKSDLPDANPQRVRQELLQHELVVEELGGDILAVDVSAKTRLNLERLEEAILLQAEILELKANPERTGEGVVIEAKLERGRGSVATVLVQRGTLRVGDAFVAGSEWGKVRALVNDRGQAVQDAPPATPVEVLGLSGTPLAGDDFTVVENEARAREIAEFRQRKKREAANAATRGTLEQMFNRIQAGEVKELPIVIKGDVQGSIEAISGALEKLAGDNTEVKVRVLHSSVGAINESDVTLANASKAMIIGFNVRANPQARDMARRDGIDIRYYSVIYDVIDDVKQALTGMLSPTLRERFLGHAEIRDVFNITKVGKVAGCFVTDGVVKRGAGVRLLRDNVVIHTGTLKTLKRFKDEVREVREGYECGMAFENYDNIQNGDVIEAYEIEEVARQL